MPSDHRIVRIPIAVFSLVVPLVVTLAWVSGAVAADDIPGVLKYTFKNVDPIKIYAGPVIFDHSGHVTIL